MCDNEWENNVIFTKKRQKKKKIKILSFLLEF